MKYLRQFCIILGFSFAGELLQRLTPLPIPASVYGLVLLFAALCLGVIRLQQVQDAAGFLLAVMPVLFVAPAVGLVEQWELIRPQLIPLCLLLLSSTALTFGVSGRIVQRLLHREEGGHAS